MKNLFFVVVCLIVACCSCTKKNEPIHTYSLQATVDGVKNTFDAYSGFISLAASNSVSAEGYNTYGSPASYLKIVLSSDTVLAPGTYTVLSKNKKPAVLISINYILNGSYQYQIDSTGTRPATITINTISSTSVHGTFSGDLVYVGTASPGVNTVLSVTNGTFDNPQVPLGPK
jgi:hypothetical protein